MGVRLKDRIEHLLVLNEAGQCHGDASTLSLPGIPAQERVVRMTLPKRPPLVTSKGQVHHPRRCVSQFGLARGSRSAYSRLVGGSHRAGPLEAEQPLPESGFGLVKTQPGSVPADFEPAEPAATGFGVDTNVPAATS